MAAKRPFALMMQAALIGLLAFSLTLITQQSNRNVYHLGMLLLIVSTLFQMAFGNIPSNSGLIRSLMYLVIAAILIGGIVLISIALVPSLLDLGKR